MSAYDSKRTLKYPSQALDFTVTIARPQSRGGNETARFSARDCWFGWLALGGMGSGHYRKQPDRWLSERTVRGCRDYATGYERLPAMAAELVKLKVGVIITSGGPQTARVATTATNEIPIVFLSGSDPVTDGLIKSHNRPGGNITGVHVFTVSLGPKRLDFLRQLVPHGTRFGFLVNPNAVTRDRQIVEVEEASRAAGVSMRVFSVGNEAQLDEVFTRLVEHRIEGLLMSADLFFQVQRDKLVSLAAQHSIPVMYEWSDFVVAGGLASYSSIRAEGFVQVGVQAGRILNGANPGDLPIVSSTKFEFVINLKTARSLGIQVSPALIARADEVIE